MQAFSHFIQSLCSTVVVLWIGLAFVGYFLSERMIFFPPKPPTYQQLKGQVTLRARSGDAIAAVYRFNPKARYTVLLSHGNAEDLGTFSDFINQVYNQGYSVMAYDYPGYGQSAGSSTEQGAYESVLAAYDYLVQKQKLDPTKIVAFGHSLGAAMAIHLASQKPLGGLIVEGAFVTAFRVRTIWPLLPFDRFDNLGKLKQIGCPILFVHGTADEVIPLWHGQALYDAYAGQKTALWLQGLGHNNVHVDASEAFWRAWQQWFAKLAGAS